MPSAPARPDRYNGVAMLLHWAIALLVITNLALGLLQESLFNGIGSRRKPRICCSTR